MHHMTLLPPGQRKVDGFPRFGTHLHHPPPAIPPDPAIDVTGAVRAPLVVALTELDGLPRVERVADFHCVAGWSATGLRWEGVSFPTLYRKLIEPQLTPAATVTHVVFRGWDGYSTTVLLEDALAEDVLVATRLDGEPLSPAHGAPVRLVSPSQYGFVSTKHLRSIEVHTRRPRNEHPYTVLTRSHSRARVWHEERHPWFPAAVVRPVYRGLIRPIARLSARGVH
jgi:DMSO/TMAO reductase YedYZ molybdopterin-dependent catalytic subunit